jgi:ADP-dependent NAD(P)H-hydrate dehydratase / NAD(P)H-hydrate epimerase
MVFDNRASSRLRPRPRSNGPQRVLPVAQDAPLHDAAAARQIERTAAAAGPQPPLMEAAGLGVARLARAVAPQAARIAVICGPGNNGGDGFVAARQLASVGVDVHVQAIGDRARLPPDAAAALAALCAAGLSVHQQPPPQCDLAIDALFGIGLTRAPADAAAEAIEWLAGIDAPVLAVDLPSGLDGDRGAVVGAQAVRARWTLSLLTLKPGLFTAQGRDHAGEIWFDPLGVAADSVPPTAWLAGAHSAAQALAPRTHAQHKGSFGDVLIVGGAGGMAGAAVLAGAAALAAGAGRVFISASDGGAAPAALLPPELMVRPRAWAGTPAELARCTVVCGCGAGDSLAEVLPPLIAHAGRLVLDADALNALAREPLLVALVAARAAKGRSTILTPHPLEAARLLGTDAAAVQIDRLAAARRLSANTQSVVALKGSGTCIASPQGRLKLNPTGNARLAAPGTGDVLAGWVGGSWSQRASDDDASAAFEIASAAVWIHGFAVDIDTVESRAVAAGDLPKLMQQAATSAASWAICHTHRVHMR